MRRTGYQAAIVIAVCTVLLGACNALNLSQQPDDKAIASEIQAKLFQDPVLKTRDIRVVSQKGVVALSGTVSTDQEKATVESLAGQASGVKQVINQLTVLGSSATPSPAPETASEPAPAPAPRRPARRSRSATASSASAAAETAPVQAAPRPVESASAPPPPPPPPPQPQRITIPSGTVVTVRTIDSIDSAQNRPGEEFAASVESPVVVENRVVIPQGADARLRLVQAKSAGHMTGSSELQLELIALTVNGNTHNVESGYYELRGASRGKRTAETVGGGAGLGALIGAIAGKGKGAAIGAAVGAGAGTAVQAATRGQQVKIPSETKLDFTLKTPITVTPQS